MSILDDLKALKNKFHSLTGMEVRQIYLTGWQYVEGLKRGIFVIPDNSVEIIMSPEGAKEVEKFLAEDVKQPEELVPMGGYFYKMGDEAWCDTPTASWRLVPGLGYVRENGGE